VRPLGPWLRSDSSWIWYFSPEDKTRLSICGELWKQHLHLSGPYRVLCFQRHEFVVHQPPIDLQPASVYFSDSRVMLSGFAPQVANYILPVIPFHNFLTSKPKEKWCFQHLLLSDNGENLCVVIQSHTAIALSDGSYKDIHGGAAWVLEGENKHGRISGAAVAPGDEADHSSYRSEITGLYCIILAITRLVEYRNVQGGTITVGCDGQSALSTVFTKTMPAVTDPC
jgi:hypothetical protein